MPFFAIVISSLLFSPTDALFWIFSHRTLLASLADRGNKG
jgi:hypothetical protein